MLLIFCIIAETESKSQADLTGYENLSVLVQVDGYGSFYTEAIYSPKGLLYISVEDLFKFFKIPCTPGQNGESLSGFIENGNRPYTINYQSGEVVVNEKVTDAQNAIIKQVGTLFMESSVFGQAFGINLKFNFRSLSVSVRSDFELPVVKEQRLEKMRNNVRKNIGEIVADTVLNRNYHMLRLGTLDWSVGALQATGKTAETRLGLGLGAELFKGEANVFLNYSNKYKFDNRLQQYMWRWVDNNNRFVKQVQLGKISTQSISSVYYPVVGAIITNTPSSIRRAAGSYTINEVTQPDWFVELYINNVLMDFTKADASGLFTFKVPIVYGYTTLTLRFYGPMGEERSETRTTNVPYSFMPAGKFEYRISSGMLEDGKESIFGRGEGNFGVNRFLTLGAGAEYLEPVQGSNFIPFVTASILPLNKLMIKGEYDYKVRINGLLNYYLWSNTMLEIDYTKYTKGQHAILYNYLEERKASFSIPLKISYISGFARLGYKQNVYSDFNYNMAELLISAYYRQFNANLSTYANWINDQSVNMNMMMALSYRMKNGLTIRPSAQVNLTKGEILAYKAEVEKRFIHNGYLAVYYENNSLLNYNSFNLSFKYDLSFAQTNASVRYSKKNILTYQGARGSLAFGSSNKHVQASAQSSVGRGGLSLIPFVDLNHNGIFDNGEPMVGNLSVKINGGRVIHSKKDSIIRVTGLEPFVSYNLELSDKNFVNIAWQLKYKNYKVLVDPDQFKTIEIPVIPAGEISGMVYLKSESTMKGIGRILINIYNMDGVKIAEALSESDGYISYLGLEPGKYYARVDEDQLRRLDMTSDPASLSVKIAESIDGDVADGLVFKLMMKGEVATENAIVAPQKPVPAKDSTYVIIHGKTNMIIHESSEEMNAEAGTYTIQLGAFQSRTAARNLFRKLEKYLGNDIKIVEKDGLFKVGIPGLRDQKEVNEKISLLEKAGIPEIWMIRMKQKQQKAVSTQNQVTYPVTKETIIEKPVPAAAYSIQIGAFLHEADALAFRDKNSGKLDKQVVVVPEGAFYKVRVIGFASPEEMNNYLPLLRSLGLSQIWALPVKSQENPIPVIKQPVVEEKPGAAKPTIALQIGVFHNRTQAQNAQNKIITKLRLPVEIVEQWDYYRVIITGFYTREEASKYYPGLAELGYSDVSVVEIK
jgi:cell division septation protein DedD